MMPDPRLVEAADRNLIGAFAALIPHVAAGGAVRRFGGVTSVVTGLPHPFYNPVFVLSDAATTTDLTAAIEAARAAGVEPAVQVLEALDAAIGPHLRAVGFEREAWVTPGMVLDPVPATIPGPPAGLGFERVHDVAGLDRFFELFGPSALLRKALTESAIRDETFRILVGSDAEGPATSAIAARTENEFGVYAVGTAERARRRGYGTAITWAALEAGRDAWGLTTAVLQSSELGLGVYSKMGFVEVRRYVEYDPPSPALSDAAPQG